MRLPRFTIYRDAKREWRWRLQAKNSRTLADSAEGYTRRWDALSAARRASWAVIEAEEPK